MRERHVMIAALVAACPSLLPGCSSGSGRSADTEARGESIAAKRATATDSPAAAGTPDTPGTPVGTPVELVPRVIPLAGNAASRLAEFSGLAWHRGRLVLLPQFPRRFGPGPDGALLAIPEDVLAAHVSGAARAPIAPQTIELVAGGVLDTIPGAQGFEAIAFRGDRAFVTVEASDDGRMIGHLIAGEMVADGTRLVLDPSTRVEIPTQSQVPNAAEETLVVTEDRVITIHEANGKNLNSSPVAHVFDHRLKPLGTVPFPAIEYRVIDASDIDDQGRFWLANYFYVGDQDRYEPAADPIVAKYGQGPTHRESGTVERLVLARYTDAGVTLVDRPPLWFALGDRGRNWEGLARWGDRGFFVVTDMHPETVFAHVPLSEP